MHEDAGERITGRRTVDDDARLVVAENSLLRIEKKYDTLAGGQEVISSVLIGALHKDGTTTPGLVNNVADIRAKQNDTSDKIDAINVDMGDLKTAQADQAKTLAQHGTDLAEIKKWFALGVGYLKEGALWIARGVVGALGLGALHLLTAWWPSIVNFFTTMIPSAAEAASRMH